MIFRNYTLKPVSDFRNSQEVTKSFAFAINMKIPHLIAAAFAATILTAFAGELEIEKREINSLGFELPAAIRMRAEMAALQKAEFIASNKEVGLEALAADDSRVSVSSWVQVYRASDGVIFLADNLNMALWVRDDAAWRCIVSGLRIDKTMGGAPARLPVQYLGDGLFAIAETVPGTVSDKSKYGFPQARAVTFLIDSKDVKVKERSVAYVYDHNPPLSIPKEWANRYKFISQQDGTGQSSIRPESKSEGSDKPQPEAEGRSR